MHVRAKSRMPLFVSDARTSYRRCVPNEVTTARLRLVARPHWVNGWVLRLAARPYVKVDGQEHSMRWGRGLVLPISAGDHLVETFIRYRGSRVNLGLGRLVVAAAPGDDIHLHARNGWANHMQLQPVLASA